MTWRLPWTVSRRPTSWRNLIAAVAVFLMFGCGGTESSDAPKAAPAARPAPHIPPLAPIRSATERPTPDVHAPAEVQTAPETPPAKPREASPEAMASLPAGLSWAGGINAEAIRHSPIYRQMKPWIDWAMAHESVADMLQQSGLTVDNIHHLVAGGQIIPLSGVAVAHGSFDASKLRAVLVKRASAAGELSERSASDVTLHVSADHDAAIAAIDKGTVAVGTTRLVEGVAKVRNSDAPSTASDPDLITMQGHIDTSAAVWAAARIPELALASLRREIEARSIPLVLGARELLGATAAAASLDIRSGVTLRIAARLRSAEAARLVASQLRLALRVIDFVADRSWLSEMSATANGPVIEVVVAIDEELWEEVSFWIAVAAQLAM
ncbi:MAG: hypothetical protein ACI9OJ_004452 [Myxococcota bacterium]|jgi:hypothetical protein